MTAGRRPAYSQLPLSPFGGRHSWDIEVCRGVGALGLISAEDRLAALREVRTGETISLVASLTAIDPPFFGRSRMERKLQVKRGGILIDEGINSFFPQVSSQWDGLNHVAAGPDMFYGGTPFADQTTGATNGIDVWASTGIVTRGVLLDLEPLVIERGGKNGPGSDLTISADELADVASRHGVSFRNGDILVMRTGFFEWYDLLSYDERAKYAGLGPQITAAGVEHTEEISRFLWDAGIVAVATDSLGFEAWPPDPRPEKQPFGLLHSSLIGHLGIAIGELWKLDVLYRRCREIGRFDFLVVSVPLNIPGGTGSPSNAIAIL